MNNNRIILHLTLLLLTFIMLSCKKQIDGSDNEPRNVKGASAAFRDLPDEAAGFGSLSFISKTDISSPNDAVIKKLFFREGDSVKKGDILIQLENPQINLAVERAENNFTQAEAAKNLADSRLLEGIFQAEAKLLSLEKADVELAMAKRKWEEDNRKHQNQEILYQAGGIHTEAILSSRFGIDSEWEQILLLEKELEIRRIGCRDQDLIKAGIIVPSNEKERIDAFVSLMTTTLKAEYDSTCARLEASEKELNSANIALFDLTIYSPVSGTIGARYLEEGERTRFQDKILSIIDSSSLYAIFPINEKTAVRIKTGMYASVLIDGTGEKRDGIVDLVYPQADSQSMSFLVRVLIENSLSDNNLKPGMFIRAAITLGPPQKIICINESAIIKQKNNEGSIFIINGSILAERKITLGVSYGDEREIYGLNEGEIYVVKPETDLKEGIYVKVI